DQAEAVALEVKQWGLNYSLFEDTPEKVAAAARALRSRDRIRNASPRERSSQGVYDELVQASRQLIKAGRLDEAEAKARMAQRMDVVPALTADRAESVLHEINMARARTPAPAQPAGAAPVLAVGGAEPTPMVAPAAPAAPAVPAAMAPPSDPEVRKSNH